MRKIREPCVVVAVYTIHAPSGVKAGFIPRAIRRGRATGASSSSTAIAVRPSVSAVTYAIRGSVGEQVGSTSPGPSVSVRRPPPSAGVASRRPTRPPATRRASTATSRPPEPRQPIGCSYGPEVAISAVSVARSQRKSCVESRQRPDEQQLAAIRRPRERPGARRHAVQDGRLPALRIDEREVSFDLPQHAAAGRASRRTSRRASRSGRRPPFRTECRACAGRSAHRRGRARAAPRGTAPRSATRAAASDRRRRDPRNRRVSR